MNFHSVVEPVSVGQLVGAIADAAASVVDCSREFDVAPGTMVAAITDEEESSVLEEDAPDITTVEVGSVPWGHLEVGVSMAVLLV